MTQTVRASALEVPASYEPLSCGVSMPAPAWPTYPVQAASTSQPAHTYQGLKPSPPRESWPAKRHRAVPRRGDEFTPLSSLRTVHRSQAYPGTLAPLLPHQEEGPSPSLVRSFGLGVANKLTAPCRERVDCPLSPHSLAATLAQRLEDGGLARTDLGSLRGGGRLERW